MTQQQILELGYYNPKKINGIWCALCRFAFTTGLIVDIGPYGYKYRYCFENKSDAIDSLKLYEDVNEHPSGNWIKRKGEGGELRNENYILE